MLNIYIGVDARMILDTLHGPMVAGVDARTILDTLHGLMVAGVGDRLILDTLCIGMYWTHCMYTYVPMMGLCNALLGFCPVS